MLSQESVRLSKKDLKTYKVIEKFRSGTYSREQAALKLCVSARTVSRKARSLRESGIEGLIHGNRGKSPRSRKSAQGQDPGDPDTISTPTTADPNPFLFVF